MTIRLTRQPLLDGAQRTSRMAYLGPPWMEVNSLSSRSKVTSKHWPKIGSLLPGRLNPSRIERCIAPENPERGKLMQLAAGMEVDLPEGFVPNGETPDLRSPLRKKYVETHLAVDCMFYAMFTAGLAFIFSTETALRVPRVHFSPAHWAK